MQGLILLYFVLPFYSSCLNFQQQFPKLFQGSMNGYFTFNQSMQMFSSWKSQYIVPFQIVGNTYQNKSLQMIGLTKIQNKSIQNLKKYPAVLINSLIHARQKNSLTLLMATFLKLESLIASSQQINFLFENSVIWFIPFVNLDAVLLIQKLWYQQKVLNSNIQLRKNLNNSQTKCIIMNQGVDLNRNFDVKWQHTKMNPCSQQFPGAQPFSQKQSQAIKKIYQDFKITIAIDMHGYGNSWIYPYSYDRYQNDLKSNSTQLRFYTKLIKQFKNINTRIGNSYQILQYNSEFGVYIDWALKVGTFSLAYQVGDTFFYDQMERLINSINQSLPSILILVQRNSYNVEIVCSDLMQQNHLKIIGLESLSAIPINVHIEQIAYWKDLKQQSKKVLKRFTINPLEQLLLAISPDQNQLTIQFISNFNNSIYTKTLIVSNDLTSCKNVLPRQSNLLNYIFTIIGVFITGIFLAVIIKKKFFSKVNQDLSSQSPVELSEMKEQEFETKQIEQNMESSTI